ncbi:hypothetical protein [Hymenobacter weizhouensis]|uniref:hypothetical protein n=1 Tax=Hymenobacter sp. YIM 151500-1 TaxID=2987689 RepID=UPI002227743A|nr:hypothetical protein [Hymenobacter sp. YIM 151500-1]UYZ61996.1 hypothetical protein OIS53_13400 [Hymenobacter sp. YIM 151500-1]
MKGFLALTLLILLATAAAQFFLPWWSITPLCLALAAWRGGTGGRTFLAGLLGAGLPWWLGAAWLNTHGAGLLAGRLATLLPLGGNGWLLVLVTGLVAGLVGGLAALAGAWVRQAVAPRPQPQQYLHNDA